MLLTTIYHTLQRFQPDTINGALFIMFIKLPQVNLYAFGCVTSCDIIHTVNWCVGIAQEIRGFCLQT